MTPKLPKKSYQYTIQVEVKALVVVTIQSCIFYSNKPTQRPFEKAFGIILCNVLTIWSDPEISGGKRSSNQWIKKQLSVGKTNVYHPFPDFRRSWVQWHRPKVKYLRLTKCKWSLWGFFIRSIKTCPTFHLWKSVKMNSSWGNLKSFPVSNNLFGLGVYIHLLKAEVLKLKNCMGRTV